MYAAEVVQVYLNIVPSVYAAEVVQLLIKGGDPTASHDTPEKGVDKHLWASDGDTQFSGQDECIEKVCGDPRAFAYFLGELLLICCWLI